MIFSYPNLICSFSKRPQNMSLFYGDTEGSLNNRKLFLEQIGIDYRDLVCARQVHGNAVHYVLESDKGRGALDYSTAIPDTDALITNKRGLPLAVFTADCLSLFLYDSRTASIGLAHAGWRSSQSNIIARALQLMREKFNTQPQDLYAGLGPCIRDCCYEVGEEFRDYFNQALIEKNGRYYLDLVGFNVKQLLDLGVPRMHISDCGICTSCRNEEFFSYRRERNSCGRMMSVIMLV